MKHPVVLKTNLPVDPIGGNLIDHLSWHQNCQSHLLGITSDQPNYSDLKTQTSGTINLNGGGYAISKREKNRTELFESKHTI